VVYFSLAVDEKGAINNLQFYDEPPVEANAMKNLIAVAFVNDTPPAVTASPSKEEIQNMFKEVVKKAYDHKPQLTNADGLLPVQFFFKASFRLEKEKTPTT
jgi:hypothetical protein